MLKIIKFENPTCQPCKVVGSALDKLRNKYTFELTCVDVYTDEGAELASLYRVMSVPTLVFECDGLRVDRFTDLVTELELESAIQQYTT